MVTWQEVAKTPFTREGQAAAMQSLRLALVLIAMTGCGSDAQPAKHKAEGIATENAGEKTLDAASVIRHMSADQLVLGEPLVNSIGMILVPIPAVESPTDANLVSDGLSDGKAHARMTITKPFYLSVCEVTRKQFEQVMGTRPWQGAGYQVDGPDYPATELDLNTAVEFCRKLGELEGAEYHLPTEAQWNYAASIGTRTISTPQDDHRNEQCIHRVAQNLPNAWGLFDMHNNAWEFCQRESSSDSITHVMVGGSYFCHSENVRAKEPFKSLPTSRFVYVGMRVARAYP